MDHSALEEAASAVERSAGALASAAVSRMEETLPWFRQLSAEQRSWIALVAHNGVEAFVRWLRAQESTPPSAEEIFYNAPRSLMRTLTLQYTLALVQVTLDVAQEHVPYLVVDEARTEVREAVLRYSRDLAFAAAEVYAHAAETRGAWDTRLQALLVDAVLAGDPDTQIASRAAALGWKPAAPISVVVGAPPIQLEETELLTQLAAAQKRLDVEILASVQEDRLIIVLAGAEDPLEATQGLCSLFGSGPVVVGDPVQTLPEATRSAQTAKSSFHAAAAWADAPRPVAAVELLPERVLAGETSAREQLIVRVYTPLIEAGTQVHTTLQRFLENGGALEATARALYVHPNTVRYRLKRVRERCGCHPMTSRGAFTLHIALIVGSLDTEHDNGL